MIAAGRANLQERLPKTYIEIAILNATGGADFLKQDLVEAFADVRDVQLQSDFKNVNDAAQQSRRAFAAWLKTEKLPKATDDFRIGRDGFVRMLGRRVDEESRKPF